MRRLKSSAWIPQPSLQQEEVSLLPPLSHEPRQQRGNLHPRVSPPCIGAKMERKVPVRHQILALTKLPHPCLLRLVEDGGSVEGLSRRLHSIAPLTSKCASRHNGVHCFDISTSKSGLTLRCFVHFRFEMCFAPQRRAIFHLSSGQLAPHLPL